jgi:hypothetical protein
MQRVKLTAGIAIVTVLAVFAVWDRHSKTEQEREAQRQPDAVLTAILSKSEQSQQAIAGMASAFDAVTDWAEAFGGERFPERVPIEELGPVLARKDRRPLLVIGSLVDVDTHGEGCKLVVDAKANLVSNIRFWLACTPAQVKEALSPLPRAHSEALEEIREEEEEGVEETTRQRKEDNREAEQTARQGYAFVAQVNSVRSEEAETIDHPGVRAHFAFVEGRCLQLLYVGRTYASLDDKEAFLRLNTSEVEARARQQMALYSETHKVAH